MCLPGEKPSLFRRETSHAGRQEPRSPGCAEHRPSGGARRAARGLDGCRRRPPRLGRIHDGSDSGTDLGGEEPAGSEFVQQFAWWSYGATMPAFFALAGYAAAAVLEVKGTRGYAVDRARRIGLPFLAALPAILVPTVLIWMLGLYLGGRCDVGELLAMSFADGQIQDNRFGPAHLWFLAYLIPMLALLGVVQSCAGNGHAGCMAC